MLDVASPEIGGKHMPGRQQQQHQEQVGNNMSAGHPSNMQGLAQPACLHAQGVLRPPACQHNCPAPTLCQHRQVVLLPLLPAPALCAAINCRTAQADCPAHSSTLPCPVSIACQHKEACPATILNIHKPLAMHPLQANTDGLFCQHQPLSCTQAMPAQGQ